MRGLLSCLLLGAAAAAAAQTAPVPEAAPARLPPWIVPVLRLVSETHVEPTTGVVLSRSGLVLVPSDFAGVGDEVVVLDGGNDIVRNGRPARLERAFPELGLEVLSVEGMVRAPAPVAQDGPADGDAVRLRAFPPAEQIAEGLAPVDQSATVALLPDESAPSIAAATPLPNVTGPLLDACGNLAAFSLAGGVQTLAPSAETRYRWHDALRQVLEALELPMTGAPCTPMTATETAPAMIEPPRPTPDVTEPAMPDSAAADPAPQTDSEAPAVEEPMASEPPPDELPPHEADATATEEAAGEPADEPSASRAWWWLAGGLLLLAGGAAVHRLRRAPAVTGPGADPAADGDAGGAPAVAAAEAGPEPPADARVVLRGRYVDGRPLEVSAPVSAAAINLEIGRGGADLRIDSLAVSRRHARLNGDRAHLTITDLGSSNGTSVDGVPCLEGEIMYLEAGCSVILGDVRFSVAVEPGAGRS